MICSGRTLLLLWFYATARCLHRHRHLCWQPPIFCTIHDGATSSCSSTFVCARPLTKSPPPMKPPIRCCVATLILSPTRLCINSSRKVPLSTSVPSVLSSRDTTHRRSFQLVKLFVRYNTFLHQSRILFSQTFPLYIYVCVFFSQMYVACFKQGGRCVELDCWDGDDGIPEVPLKPTLICTVVAYGCSFLF